jgi:CheY-like chemotaxis protein
LSRPDPQQARSILYLEDSPAEAARIREVLESAGYRVDVAETPSKTLGKLRTGRYAALLVDHVLERFAGAEIVLQLRDLEIDLPPTFVVSHAKEDGLAERARAYGAAGFIDESSEADFAAALLEAIGAQVGRDD